jgi:hypothetical protein
MTMVFEAYAGGAGAGSARLPLLRARASDTNRVPYGAGTIRLAGSGDQGTHGSGSLPRVRSFARASTGVAGVGVVPGFSAFGADASLVPSAAIQMAAIPMVRGAGTSISVGIGNQNAPTPRMRAFATDLAGGTSLARFPAIRGYAYAVQPPASFVFALQSAGYASIVADGALGGYNALQDVFAATDNHAADFIQALLDLMTFGDSYSLMAEVLQALMDGISLADVAQMIWQADLLDSFIASAVQEGTAQITVLLADTFDAGDATTAISEILAAIRDSFYVTLTINTGDDIYTAWVMTPETKAMRSYTNWAFNSYATLGGQFLGAGPAGIYRMGGKTDDGVAIRAAIRTGLLNFGSQNMKAVSRAYIGATTAGNLLLRVQATTFKGEQVEQTYRMVPANTTDQRAHPVAVGKGFRSVYWTFELANDTDGADFEVTDWHVLPVTLSGRLI